MITISRAALFLATAIACWGANAQTFRPLRDVVQQGNETAASSCEVHLVAAGERRDISRPCLSTLSLSSRDYDVWLEEVRRITPFRTPIKVARGGDYELPLEQGGGVTPEFQSDVETIELWHVDSHQWRNARTRAFYRDVKRDDRTVQMPIGRAVGIALDTRGEAIGLSRAATVTSDQVVSIQPRPPMHGGDLVVVLERPPGVNHSSADHLFLKGDTQRSPDLSLIASDRILGIWYGVAPGRFVIGLNSESLRLEPVYPVLRDRRVTVVHATAVRLPALRVAVTAPAGVLDTTPMSLSIEKGSQAVRKTAIEPGANVDLDAMPAEPLDVVLSFDGWRILKPIDLSSGVDGAVTFALEPLIINGIVTYGGKPVKADVAFGFPNKSPVKASSSEDGKYSLVLWQAARYAIRANVAEHPEIPSYWDTMRIQASRTIDIAIPRARYAVKVSDESTGQPIPEAVITLTNEFDDEAEGKRHTMSNVKTDVQGHSYLPPLRSGSVDLRVGADGYLETTTQRSVSDDAGDVLISIGLRHLDDPRAFHVLLKDGSPAAGAELLAISAADEVLYSATSGADGTIHLPKELPEALLVVRHPNAGASARLMTATDEHDVTWRLSAAASPLRLRVVDADGSPAAASLVFIWIDGHRIGGVALAFLSRFSSTTTTDGGWSGLNLPAAATRVLVVKRRRGMSNTNVSSFDTMAQTIEYPWPASLTVRAN